MCLYFVYGSVTAYIGNASRNAYLMVIGIGLDVFFYYRMYAFFGISAEAVIYFVIEYDSVAGCVKCFVDDITSAFLSIY